MSDDGKCPIHDVVCKNWEKTEMDVKKKVPIWVFVIAITLAGGGISWINIESSNRHLIAKKLIEKHVQTSTECFENVTKKNSDRFEKVAEAFERMEKLMNKLVISQTESKINQKRMLKKLNLEYETIDHFDE